MNTTLNLQETAFMCGSLTKSCHPAMPGVLLLPAGLFALLMPPAQSACFTCRHAQRAELYKSALHADESQLKVAQQTGVRI